MQKRDTTLRILQSAQSAPGEQETVTPVEGAETDSPIYTGEPLSAVREDLPQDGGLAVYRQAVERFQQEQAERMPTEDRQTVRLETEDSPALPTETTASPEGEKRGAEPAREGQQKQETKKAPAAKRQTVKERREDVIERTGKKNGASAEQIQTAKRLSEVFNRGVEFFRLEANASGTMNGYFDRDSGKIYINTLAAENTMWVFGHELMHSLEGTRGYDALIGYIKGRLEAQGQSLQKLREAKQKLYRGNDLGTLTNPEADAEIVADWVATNLLGSEKEIQRLVQKDLTLGRRILRWLDNVLEKLGSRKARERNRLEKAREHFRSAIQEAEKGRKVKQLREQLNREYRRGEITDEQYDARAMEIDREEEALGRSILDLEEEIEAGGVKYSYAGERARTADLEGLQTAKQMEEAGADSESIRQATGWFQGADGKWRFEIDDRQMRITNRTESTVTLGELIEHESLFEAYPQLRDVVVQFETMEKGRGGRVDKQNNRIILNETLRGAPEDVLVHEIQHVIQGMEEFAGGSNVAFWQTRINNGERFTKNARAIEQADKKYYELFESAPMELKNKVRELNRAHLDDDTESVERITDELYNGTYADLFSEIELADFDRRSLRQYDREMDARELYFSTAGEIEARDAESRREWKPERRRNFAPDTGGERAVFVEDEVESLQAIGHALGNKPFVTVGGDILNGVPEADWVSTVRENLKKKFPDGVRVGNNEIQIDYQSRKEMTFSKYMQWLFNNNPQLRADKLRATNNADEILQATTDWVNEGLNHPRKDNIKDFARGNVLLRVGTNDYIADVVVGTRKNGSMMLYDLLNLQPTEIIEKETGAAIAENPSPGTNRSTASFSGDSITEPGRNVKYSVSEYTAEEKKQHAKSALSFFGKTYKWSETGYLLTDGSKLDFSGKHEGGPSGYRTVDHRDIRDALGEDYGGEDYSGGMVQFMAEGNIRISPESGGINLSVKPTKAQMQALDDFISRERGEVILDIDDGNGNTLSSTEYPRGTRASKVINDIQRYFEDGTEPQVSQVSQFRYSISDTYVDEIRAWRNNGKPDRKRITVGTTSEALKSVGVEDKIIVWDTSKMNNIQKKHPYMTDALLEQVPQIIESPVLIMESKTQPNRVVMYGEVYVEQSDVPVMAVLELLPTKKGGTLEIDELKVANAYAKDNNDVPSTEKTQQFINESNILYVDPDKKRTNTWLSRTRLQLPFGENQYGSIDSIALVHRNRQGNFSSLGETTQEPEWKQKLREYGNRKLSVSEDSQQQEARKGLRESLNTRAREHLEAAERALVKDKAGAYWKYVVRYE